MYLVAEGKTEAGVFGVFLNEGLVKISKNQVAHQFNKKLDDPATSSPRVM